MADDAGSLARGQDDRLSRISSLLDTIEESLSAQMSMVGQGRFTEIEEMSRRIQVLFLEIGAKAKDLSHCSFPFPDRLARLGEKQRLLALTMEHQKQILAQQMRKLRQGRKLTKTYT